MVTWSKNAYFSGRYYIISVSFSEKLKTLFIGLLVSFFSTGFYSPYRTLAFLNGLLDPLIGKLV
jgi:hypothetical protein